MPPIATRWYVITGAPCAGKTSVIRELARRGWPVVQETARAYIEERQAAGESLEAIRSDEFAFETEIMRRKQRLEATLPPRQVTFLDRAVPDSIAYFRSAGLDPAPCAAASRRVGYAGVFLLERLRFEKDPVRAEDDRAAARLEALLAAAYEDLGYLPVRVPLWPVDRRVVRILAVVSATAPPVVREE